MVKIVLLLLCVLLAMLEPEAAQSAPEPAGLAPTEAAVASTIPRPNYKRYKGNSRSKKRRLGFLRRRAARRKAMRKRKQKATAPKGVIRVDAPTGTMPKRTE